MTLKDQFKKIKENWLIIAIVLVMFVVFSGGSGVVSQIAGNSMVRTAYDAPQAEFAASKAGGYYPGPSYGEDFAPEVEDRKITKTASISTEVERGEFRESEAKLKNIVTTSDSYLLNENVRKYGTERKEYMYGNYQIKVEVGKYDALVSQIKEIGEVQSFNENTVDITGQYTDLELNIELEKERLERYQAMYEEATRVEDKITLNDRIFNQERTIKYMQDRLENMDKRVEYTTVSVTLTEKRSEYMDVAIVKFSELVKGLVNSFNNLLGLIFWAVPWAIALLIAGVAWKLVKRRR